MPVIRKLRASEARTLKDHLLRLGPVDRAFRFGGAPLPDQVIERYVDHIQWPRSVQLGWFDDRTLRGVAQLVVTGDDAPLKPLIRFSGRRAAEFAVSVEANWRQQGIATRLLDQLVSIARNRWVGDLYMYCRPDNRPMRRLARNVCINLRFQGGDMEGHTDLPPPDQLTIFAEFVTDTHAWLDDAAEMWGVG